MQKDCPTNWVAAIDHHGFFSEPIRSDNAFTPVLVATIFSHLHERCE